MHLGLYIIGDEILSGRRKDRHLVAVTELLSRRGLVLSWVKILADDMDILVDNFRQSFESTDIVFSAGGIGGTPDDMTRLAAAKALGTTVERHPEGVHILEAMADRFRNGLTPAHYRMVEFPPGASLIPNPVNSIPGFSMHRHHFVPGFPKMAWPMLEWVLDHHYPQLRNEEYVEQSVMLHNVPESELGSLMTELQQAYAVKVFSLPRMVDEGFLVELGVKGIQSQVNQAMADMQHRLDERQYHWEP